MGSSYSKSPDLEDNRNTIKFAVGQQTFEDYLPPEYINDHLTEVELMDFFHSPLLFNFSANRLIVSGPKEAKIYDLKHILAREPISKQKKEIFDAARKEYDELGLSIKKSSFVGFVYDELPPNLKKMVNMTIITQNKSILRSKLGKDMVVYRGVGNRMEEELSKLKKGETYTSLTFTDTSEDLSISKVYTGFDSCCYMQISVGKNKPAKYIKRGLEKCVALPMMSEFKVVEPLHYDAERGISVIKMKYIGAPKAPDTPKKLGDILETRKNEFVSVKYSMRQNFFIYLLSALFIFLTFLPYYLAYLVVRRTVNTVFGGDGEGGEISFSLKASSGPATRESKNEILIIVIMSVLVIVSLPLIYYLTKRLMHMRSMIKRPILIQKKNKKKKT